MKAIPRKESETMIPDPDPQGLVHIGDTALTPLVWDGQRVVTFRQIDAVHQRPTGTAKKRFYDNKRHLIEGEDYWLVSQSEIRTDKGLAQAFSYKAPSGVVLSESGYLMIAKSLTDDLAWQVQRALVANYFNTRNEIRSDISDLERVRVAADALRDPEMVLAAFKEMAFHAKVLQGQVDEMRPKAAFHDQVSASRGSMPVKDAAQLCGTGQNRMFRWLREHHYLQPGNQPYQKWIDQGLFETRLRTYNRDGSTFTRTQPLITGKGLARFQREMGCGEAVHLELDANPGGWV